MSTCTDGICLIYLHDDLLHSLILNGVLVAPVLVVDFDDTITDGDTIGLLINAAIRAQSRGEPTSQETQEREEALRELKNRLVAEYVEAFQVLVERHLPENTHRKDTGLNMEHVSGFLDDLNDFEIRMNTKVTDSGILAGLQVGSSSLLPTLHVHRGLSHTDSYRQLKASS